MGRQGGAHGRPRERMSGGRGGSALLPGLMASRRQRWRWLGAVKLPQPALRVYESSLQAAVR